VLQLAPQRADLLFEGLELRLDLFRRSRVDRRRVSRGKKKCHERRRRREPLDRHASLLSATGGRAARGWLPTSGSWLERFLFCENQLVGPRDAKPIFLLTVLDDDFPPRAEQILGAHDRRTHDRRTHDRRRRRRGVCVDDLAHARVVWAGSTTLPLSCGRLRTTRGKNSMAAPMR